MLPFACRYNGSGAGESWRRCWTASARQSVKLLAYCWQQFVAWRWPLFATPRTATVSFEVGIAPLTGEWALPLFISAWSISLSLFWFALLSGQAAGYRGQLPCATKIIALVILSVAAIWPAGSISTATEAYQNAGFSNGFVNGYLTMDTLGAMVFGIVIV
ncbi:branched-chain amino acid transport system II carrier protein [Shigella flexneri]